MPLCNTARGSHVEWHVTKTQPRKLSATRAALRGVIVGAAATGADLLALVLLVTFGAPPHAANAPALCVGVAVQFVGSKLFTFEDASRRWAKQGALFLVVEAFALGLNLVLFDLGLRFSHVPYAALRIATTSLVYLGFSLPLWSLVFRNERREPA